MLESDTLPSLHTLSLSEVISTSESLFRCTAPWQAHYTNLSLSPQLNMLNPKFVEVIGSRELRVPPHPKDYTIILGETEFKIPINRH
eukprot:746234-Hanusia_phi.AAC.2